MLISKINPEELTREQITKVVFGNEGEFIDDSANADYIFVFGGSYVERAEKAVELYNKGRAPYILFSGGDKFGQRNPPEAIAMREKAIALGVPFESIIVETLSNHTKENVMASLVVLDRALGLQNIERQILVSAPGHMRRCILSVKTFMPEWYQFIWCPDDRIIGQSNNWWTDPEEEIRVRNELNKVIYGVKNKYFVDMDVEI